jgi:hypothetical protein
MLTVGVALLPRWDWVTVQRHDADAVCGRGTRDSVARRLPIKGNHKATARDRVGISLVSALKHP